ncbi:hypothetical protein [Zavarzinia marina]|nr:hypothetical protein [Zavarzinia marina]
MAKAAYTRRSQIATGDRPTLTPLGAAPYHAALVFQEYRPGGGSS